MKKLLLTIAIIATLTGCTSEMSPEALLTKGLNPFKEYKVNDTKVAKLAEDSILAKEAEVNGLDIEQSSAYVVSYTKIGEYGKGEMRILGTTKDNEPMNYTVIFEYSGKIQSLTWRRGI